MKELFKKFDNVPLDSAKDLILIDTCFFFYAIEHKLDELLELKHKALTSFNVEEILKVEHKLSGLKHSIRKFLHECDDLVIINIDISPGMREKETEFVRSVDEKILNICKDPSDAILFTVALLTGSIILTRDKHHLFTSMLNNYKDVRIIKEIKDI